MLYSGLKKDRFRYTVVRQTDGSRMSLTEIDKQTDNKLTSSWNEDRFSILSLSTIALIILSIFDVDQSMQFLILD